METSDKTFLSLKVIRMEGELNQKADWLSGLSQLLGVMSEPGSFHSDLMDVQPSLS